MSFTFLVSHAAAMLTMRPAEISDAPALARVHIQAWREAYNGIMPRAYLDALDPTARETRWREMLTNPEAGRATFVATIHNDLIGFIGCGPARGDGLKTQGEVYAINILATAQKQGAGRALMRAAVADLAKQDLNPIGLWVLEANANARTFYARLGSVEPGISVARDYGGVLLNEIAVHWPKGSVE